MWRPDNWKNPYKPKASEQIKTQHQIIYEAGADAMLGALKQVGVIQGTEILMECEEGNEIISLL